MFVNIIRWKATKKEYTKPKKAIKFFAYNTEDEILKIVWLDFIWQVKNIYIYKKNELICFY